MDVNDSTQAIPGASPAKAWLENLLGGLRLAFFRHPAAFQFHASPNHFIAIAATWLVVGGASSFALAGFGGVFNPQALPSELFWVPLALFAGYLIGRIMNDDSVALLVPIVVGSIGITLSVASSAIWFAADQRWIRVPAVLGLTGVDQLVFVWWALATLVAMKRLTVSAPGRAISPAAIVAIVVLLPAYFLPSEPLWEAALDPDQAGDQPGPRERAFSENALYAQPELLRTAMQQLKPERAGVEDVYFVGFAPYASQDVLMMVVTASDAMHTSFG